MTAVTILIIIFVKDLFMESAKRIVIVLSALDMSGPAFAALNLIPSILSSGKSVMVVGLEGGEREDLFKELGCEVRILPKLGVPLLGRKAMDEIKKFNPDIIHAQSLNTVKKILGTVSHIGCPLVVTVNRIDISEIEDISIFQDANIIALSDAIKERLINRDGFSQDQVCVIPNGIDLKHFPFNDELESSESAIKLHNLPVIGTYGTLLESKGQRDFLQAISKLKERGIDAEFLIMGHGPDKPKLREIAEELGIAHRLTFSASTIIDSKNISSIDIFVEPTRQEGFGMSVLQAMASGVPVVACGVGGIYSLIEDGENGILVTSGDTEAMCDAICRLLNDSTLRCKLIRNARTKVEQEFSSKKVCSVLLEYYDEILNQ